MTWIWGPEGVEGLEKGHAERVVMKEGKWKRRDMTK
jgi:hypothetical protein